MAADIGIESVVPVRVEPTWQDRPTLGFVAVEAGEMILGGHDEVDAFNRPVIRWALGMGPFGRDAPILVRIAPGVRNARGADVGWHLLDTDFTCGAPGHRSAQDPGRGGGLLVAVNLGVGGARLVIDDGVR